MAKAQQKFKHELFRNLLASFGGQGAEMIKMKCLGTSWSHLVIKAQNAQNTMFRSLMGPFCGQGEKMLKINWFETSWGLFGSQGAKQLK